jgi:hypothetical protein
MLYKIKLADKYISNYNISNSLLEVTDNIADAKVIDLDLSDIEHYRRLKLLFINHGYKLGNVQFINII